MAAQTAYSINQVVGYDGVVQARRPHRIISRSVEVGGGAIPFGRVVTTGTANSDRTTKLGGTPPVFLGVSVRALDTEGELNTSILQYEETETAAIMRKGYMWVRPVDPVTVGIAVEYDPVTGEFGTTVGFQTIAGAVWETAAAAGELALLNLQLASQTISLP